MDGSAEPVIIGEILAGLFVASIAAAVFWAGRRWERYQAVRRLRRDLDRAHRGLIREADADELEALYRR